MIQQIKQNMMKITDEGNLSHLIINNIIQRLPSKYLVNMADIYIYIFHCSDVEEYKSVYKSKINQWINEVKLMDEYAEWIVIYARLPDREVSSSSSLSSTLLSSFPFKMGKTHQQQSSNASGSITANANIAMNTNPLSGGTLHQQSYASSDKVFEKLRNDFKDHSPQTKKILDFLNSDLSTAYGYLTSSRMLNIVDDDFLQSITLSDLDDDENNDEDFEEEIQKHVIHIGISQAFAVQSTGHNSGDKSSQSRASAVIARLGLTSGNNINNNINNTKSKEMNAVSTAIATSSGAGSFKSIRISSFDYPIEKLQHRIWSAFIAETNTTNQNHPGVAGISQVPARNAFDGQWGELANRVAIAIEMASEVRRRRLEIELIKSWSHCEHPNWKFLSLLNARDDLGIYYIKCGKFLEALFQYTEILDLLDAYLNDHQKNQLPNSSLVNKELRGTKYNMTLNSLIGYDSNINLDSEDASVTSSSSPNIMDNNSFPRFFDTDRIKVKDLLSQRKKVSLFELRFYLFIRVTMTRLETGEAMEALSYAQNFLYLAVRALEKEVNAMVSATDEQKIARKAVINLWGALICRELELDVDMRDISIDLQSNVQSGERGSITSKEDYPRRQSQGSVSDSDIYLAKAHILELAITYMGRYRQFMQSIQLKAEDEDNYFDEFVDYVNRRNTLSQIYLDMLDKASKYYRLCGQFRCSARLDRLRALELQSVNSELSTALLEKSSKVWKHDKYSVNIDKEENILSPASSKDNLQEVNESTSNSNKSQPNGEGWDDLYVDSILRTIPITKDETSMVKWNDSILSLVNKIPFIRNETNKMRLQAEFERVCSTERPSPMLSKYQLPLMWIHARRLGEYKKCKVGGEKVQFPIQIASGFKNEIKATKVRLFMHRHNATQGRVVRSSSMQVEEVAISESPKKRKEEVHMSKLVEHTSPGRGATFTHSRRKLAQDKVSKDRARNTSQETLTIGGNVFMKFDDDEADTVNTEDEDEYQSETDFEGSSSENRSKSIFAERLTIDYQEGNKLGAVDEREENNITPSTQESTPMPPKITSNKRRKGDNTNSLVNSNNKNVLISEEIHGITLPVDDQLVVEFELGPFPSDDYIGKYIAHHIEIQIGNVYFTIPISATSGEELNVPHLIVSSYSPEGAINLEIEAPLIIGDLNSEWKLVGNEHNDIKVKCNVQGLIESKKYSYVKGSGRIVLNIDERAKRSISFANQKFNGLMEFTFDVEQGKSSDSVIEFAAKLLHKRLEGDDDYYYYQDDSFTIHGFAEVQLSLIDGKKTSVVTTSNGSFLCRTRASSIIHHGLPCVINGRVLTCQNDGKVPLIIMQREVIPMIFDKEKASMSSNISRIKIESHQLVCNDERIIIRDMNYDTVAKKRIEQSSSNNDGEEGEDDDDDEFIDSDQQHTVAWFLYSIQRQDDKMIMINVHENVRVLVESDTQKRDESLEFTREVSLTTSFQ